MTNEPLLLAVTAFTFLLAGFVKGTIGLGLPTVAMGMLGAVMPPVQAASLLVVPSLATNIWQFVAGPHQIATIRRLWPMMIGICLGTWAGAGIMAKDTSGWTTTALGVSLIAYSGIGLFAPAFRVVPRAEPWLSPLVGAATGLVTASTGVFVLPAVPYLQAIGLEKDELIQALGLSFTVSTLALAGGLAAEGAFMLPIAAISLLALVPAMAGMLLGQVARSRIRPQTFRRCFFLGLLLLGGHLAMRGFR